MYPLFSRPKNFPVLLYLKWRNADRNEKSLHRSELKEAYDIVFTRLFALNNMPIKRYVDYLQRRNSLAEYMQLLVANFNPAAAEVSCAPTDVKPHSLHSLCEPSVLQLKHVKTPQLLLAANVDPLAAEMSCMPACQAALAVHLGVKPHLLCSMCAPSLCESCTSSPGNCCLHERCLCMLFRALDLAPARHRSIAQDQPVTFLFRVIDRVTW